MAKESAAKNSDTKKKDEKDKSIELAISSIEKQFGKGSIMRLGDDATVPSLSVVSTGSLTMDIALGVGGLPRGRIIEIYGPESSGKTAIAPASHATPGRWRFFPRTARGAD